MNRDGQIADSEGSVVGVHRGIANYTVGQRAKLPASAEGARYVTRIDAATNTIVIGREDELLSRSLVADEVNLIRPELLERPGTVLAMVRYRAMPVRALARLACQELELEFEEPQRAVTPGQLVALFDETGTEVLGAATIRSAA
jgi:tRNA-specific 2-thiouridylase